MLKKNNTRIANHENSGTEGEFWVKFLSYDGFIGVKTNGFINGKSQCFAYNNVGCVIYSIILRDID